MYKISQIISLPVISLFESELQGIIYNLLFEPRSLKIKYICILDENEGIQKVLLTPDLYTLGKDCIFIKNKQVLQLECTHECIMNNHPSLLNLKVYNLKGEELGLSNDVIIDNNLRINSIILNTNKVVDAKNIVNIGNTAILINDSNINIAKFKPKLKQIKNSYNDTTKVIVLDNADHTQVSNVNKLNNTKITTNSSFLSGRILKKDIQTPNGEIIAKQNSIINSEILRKASYYGKLIEIARYSEKK